MSKQADYMTGWINTTIHDFLSAVDEPTSSMAYALVTCLDSNNEVASLLDQSKHLKGLRGKYQRVGQGILLTTHQLLTAQKNNRLFFGFDEVWFFPNADVSPKPESFVIVGPEPISSRETDQYSEWLRSNNCSLGLGDGTGMNFCLKVRGVARFIVEAFNEAVAPSVKE
jgi:hypothetical protein